MRPSIRPRALAALAAISLLAFGAAARPLRVVTTTPDLADLARVVGGDAVEVTSLTKGPQDVHFVEPRPSFVSNLHRADVLVVLGMDLEVGWLPAVLPAARNDEVSPGGRGYIDASMAIEPLEVPTGRLDRSMGDVHARGNPHYLTDPLNGLAIAGLLRDRFTGLRPDDAARFEAGHAKLAKQIVTALVGEKLAARGTPDEIAARVRSGALANDAELGGWLGRAKASSVRRAVQDHRYWPYFAHRFGLEMVETLEPKPGIAPTTAHLQKVIERIRAEKIPVLLATVYFDPRHARFVAKQSGVRVVPMAHQVGSRPGTDDYVAMIDYDVKQVFGAG